MDLEDVEPPNPLLQSESRLARFRKCTSPLGAACVVGVVIVGMRFVDLEKKSGRSGIEGGIMQQPAGTGRVLGSQVLGSQDRMSYGGVVSNKTRQCPVKAGYRDGYRSGGYPSGGGTDHVPDPDCAAFSSQLVNVSRNDTVGMTDALLWITDISCGAGKLRGDHNTMCSPGHRWTEVVVPGSFFGIFPGSTRWECVYDPKNWGSYDPKIWSVPYVRCESPPDTSMQGSFRTAKKANFWETEQNKFFVGKAKHVRRLGGPKGQNPNLFRIHRGNSSTVIFKCDLYTEQSDEPIASTTFQLKFPNLSWLWDDEFRETLSHSHSRLWWEFATLKFVLAGHPREELLPEGDHQEMYFPNACADGTPGKVDYAVRPFLSKCLWDYGLQHRHRSTSPWAWEEFRAYCTGGPS